MDVSAPAQLITAPAQPPATGVAVYTTLFSFVFRLFPFHILSSFSTRPHEEEVMTQITNVDVEKS